MSGKAEGASSSQQSLSRLGNYLDSLEQALGKNRWEGVVIGAFTLVALLPALPALSPLLRYRIDVPMPVLAALGVVVAGHEFGGWCWRR